MNEKLIFDEMMERELQISEEAPPMSSYKQLAE